MFNVSYRKVGGLRFVKLGRLTFMFCVSRRYRDLNAPKRTTLPDRKFRSAIDGELVPGFTGGPAEDVYATAYEERAGQ